MEITLNNRIETFDADEMTVSELLEIKKFTFKMLIVKINNQLVKREDFSHSVIKDGDIVMVLHLISGG